MEEGLVKLNKDELAFCELYVNGTVPYAGNSAKCYADVFHVEDEQLARSMARKLLMRPDVSQYMDALEEEATRDGRGIKRYISENLFKIVEETSKAQYYDRRGTALSPAPLRRTAIEAMRLLADLYPVKEAQVNKFDIDGGDGSSVTFNVIVPDASKLPLGSNLQ